MYPHPWVGGFRPDSPLISRKKKPGARRCPPLSAGAPPPARGVEFRLGQRTREIAFEERNGRTMVTGFKIGNEEACAGAVGLLGGTSVFIGILLLPQTYPKPQTRPSELAHRASGQVPKAALLSEG